MREQLFELSTKAAGNAKDEWSEDLKIGSYVEGEIQDIKDYGVIMNLYKHKEIVGFLTHYQCEYILQNFSPNAF